MPFVCSKHGMYLARWGDESCPKCNADAAVAPRLNVYTALYHESGKWGAWVSGAAVIVANTEEEALGFLLMRFADTRAKFWHVRLLDQTKPGISEHISDVEYND